MIGPIDLADLCCRLLCMSKRSHMRIIIQMNNEYIITILDLHMYIVDGGPLPHNYGKIDIS